MASTKSFLGQVVSLTLLAMLLGAGQVGRLDQPGRSSMLFSELADTAEQVERILADCDPRRWRRRPTAMRGRDKSPLFVGRGMGAAIPATRARLS